MFHIKNGKHESKGVNPLAAGVAGAVVGAGIAVGAVALKDGKNRAKVKGVLKAVKKKANSYMDDIEKRAHHERKEAQEKMDEVTKIAVDK